LITDSDNKNATVEISISTPITPITGAKTYRNVFTTDHTISDYRTTIMLSINYNRNSRSVYSNG
jgi:hypothetical protein